jgi:hypothetical protein
VNFYSAQHARVLKSFIELDVKFILIGGHAAIFHGVRRNTGDMDILVEPTAENGAKVIKALKLIELEMPDIDPSEFEKPLVLSFGFEPDAVDIINHTPGIEFQAAYKNAKVSDLSGVHIPVISINDLIKNKESLKRVGEKSHLDHYDIEVLKKIANDKKRE